VRRLLTPRWLAVHAGAVVIVLAFLGLGWWQWVRAEDGNARSLGYMFEWPVFALFVIFVWVRTMWQEVRRARGDEPEPDRLVSTRRRTVTPLPADDEQDEELAAYNRYLARLNAEDETT
jgi:DNA-binding transcriptional regulator of glucitol operon